MNPNLYVNSLYSPVLVAQAPCNINLLDIEKQCFESVKKCEDLPCESYGIIEIINQTSIPIICGKEIINPNFSGLFWSSFTRNRTADSSTMPLSNSFKKLLENEFECVVVIHSITASRGTHSKITITDSPDKSKNHISTLIEQFQRYFEEFSQNGNEYLFSERKKAMPEFVKFLEDPEGLKKELWSNGALICEMKTGVTLQLQKEIDDSRTHKSLLGY